MKVIVTIFLLFSCFATISAQTYTWDDFIAEFYDEEVDYTEEDIDELYELYASPLNINDLYFKHNNVQSAINTLKKLPFISENQINAIEYYVNHNFPVRTIGELMLIRELDHSTRMRLQPFICVKEIPDENRRVNLQKLIHYAKNEAIVRTDIPLYKKKGYKEHSYSGSPLYHSIRYQIKSMNHLTAGLQMEKDAGERGIDYFSAYLLLQDIGPFSKIMIGDYKISFGMGLTINNNMTFGKQSFLNSFNTLSRGLTKHSSMSESNHMRGIATTINIRKNIHFTAFLSSQNIDGTMRNDSTGGMSSLKTDGLHRTDLEKSKKGITTETTWGANLEWHTNNATIGVTGINTHLSNPLLPKYNTPSSEYRQYNLQGSDFMAMSLSYKLRMNRFTIQGETAYSENGRNKYSNHYDGLATINALRYRINSYTSVVSILRYYDYRFSTLYSKSLSNSSKPQNELGAFIGIKSDVNRKIHIESYFDLSQNPKPTMQAAAKAHNIEAALQMNCMTSKKSVLQIRYRLKAKEKDYEIANDKTSLYYQTNHNLKMQYNTDLGHGFSTRSNVLANYVFNPENSDETGILLSENIRWEKKKADSSKGYGIGTTITYFNTDSYNSRVYAYEPSLLYTYGMSSFYGKGIRLSLLATLQLKSNLKISTKVGATKYFDRETISSASEQINSSHREDIQVQLHWKF